MIRAIHILLLAIFVCGHSFAADVAPLRFVETKHDFGTIREDGGVHRHAFRFVNTGSQPIVVLKVGTSCGCTTAEYSRKPIAPRGEGEIIVTYDPMNQPSGDFMRRATVYTSEGNCVLTITGRITPREKSLYEQYALVVGEGLRADANAHAFGYIEQGHSARSSFAIVNDSDATLEITLVPSEESGRLDVRYPRSLQPHEQSVIDFGYDLSSTGEVYGTLKDVLMVDVNGRRSSMPLVINAIAIDDRAKFADSEAPKVELSENFIKFGTVKRNTPDAERRIEIRNVGIAPLTIRAIESEYGVAEPRVVGTRKVSGAIVVPSDGVVIVAVTIRPSQCSVGVVNDRLRIITDDPHSPMRSVRVTAVIER